MIDLIDKIIKEIKANEDIAPIFNQIAREDFYCFFLCCYNYMHQNKALDQNWHLDYLSRIAEAVFKGEIKRLIINIPPRTLKSFLLNSCFSCWFLGKMPESKIISCSYSMQIALHHNKNLKDIIISDWYREIFPAFEISKGNNRQNKFYTTKNGSKFATSTNSSLTGEGGDLLILDDPQNPIHIYNKKRRHKDINWFESVFSSRLNDKKTGIIILITQRLHSEDLTGYLLKSQKSLWEHINIPMIANKKSTISIGTFTKDIIFGELLHPKREPMEVIQELKQQLGHEVFQAQYQQNPIDSQGFFLKKDWIIFYENDIQFDDYFFSIDCASTKGSNDYSVLIKFGIIDDKIYIEDILRERIGYIELKEKVLRLLKKNDNFIKIIIENKHTGISLIDDLSLLYKDKIYSFNPKNSKEIRFAKISHFFESKKILINQNKNFHEELINELISFPCGSNDDQVDSITQFLIYYENELLNKKKDKSHSFKVRFI